MEGSALSSKRFLPGELVEVRQREKGLRGSWHPAVIIEVQRGKRKVEYEELLDDDGLAKLKEVVPVGRASDGDRVGGSLHFKSPPKKAKPVLRPRPPPVSAPTSISWTEGLKVDCYSEDAWWEGILLENVANVVCGDIASLTPKSSVQVLFPDENDVSEIIVKQMRIGQEWDEDTGLWSRRGSGPVPVPVGRPKKRAKQTQPVEEESSNDNMEVESKEVDAAMSEVEKNVSKLSAGTSAFVPGSLDVAELLNEEVPSGCELLDTITIDSIISKIELQHVSEYGAFSTPLDARPTSEIEHNVSDPLLLGARPTSEIEHNISNPLLLDAKIIESKSLNVGSAAVGEHRFEVSAYAENGKLPHGKSNEESTKVADETMVGVEKERGVPPGKPTVDVAAAQKLLMDSGWKVTPNARKKDIGSCIYKSPRVDGGFKTFTTLSEALEFEERRIASASQSMGGSAKGVRVPLDEVLVSEKTDDDVDVASHKLLVDAGWNVSKSARKKGEQAEWVFTPPKPGRGKKKLPPFTSLSAALAECRKSVDSKSSKQIGDRLNALSSVDVAKNESGPSRTKLDQAFNKTVVTPEGYLDQDDDRTELDVVVNSDHDGISADLGEKLIDSHGNAPDGDACPQRSFGIISDIIEEEGSYILQLGALGFSKDQVKVMVENHDLLIKARYNVDVKSKGFSVRRYGTLSSRVALPKNVESTLISAELKAHVLILTLPKSLNESKKATEIPVK